MSMKTRWYSNPTQIFWACKNFIEGREISHLTEIHEQEGWRLAAIVKRLSSEYEWPILSERRGSKNIAHYRLAPNTIIARLHFPPSPQTLRKGGDA